MINLIPIGQLDGGHVMRAWLDDKHERLSAVLHRGLGAVALVAGAVLYGQARSAGRTGGAAFSYAAYAVMPWLLWAVALYAMRRMGDGQYHPPVMGPPLSRARRRLAVAMVILFLVVFVPIPMRPAL
jgi:membrane-associated protease RseP (regulator of RpoE activity)